MKTIGKFRLVAQIKCGDQIITYRGYDPSQEKMVLIKVATIPMSAKDPALQRLQKEAEIYRKIHHPNVAQLIETGIDDIYPYLVLEFIEGTTLRKLISRHGPLPLDIALFCLIDLLSGLSYIHQKGLIHQDLKPENLILQVEGQLKICDFDLAFAETDLQQGQKGLTGSVGYICPEMILGEPVGQTSDLFSVGVIAYEMLAGARPFKRDTADAEFKAIVQNDPLPLSRLNGRVPSWLASEIEKMLAKSPGQRPKTAGTALKRLKQSLQMPPSQRRRKLLIQYLKSPETYQSAALPMGKKTMAVKTGRPRNRFRKYAFILGSPVVFLMLLFAFYLNESAKQNNVKPFPAFRNGPQPSGQPSRQKIEMPKDSFALATQNDIDMGKRHPANSSALITSNSETSMQQKAPARFKKRGSSSAFKGKTVYLRTVPWAYIFIDGDSLGISNEMGAHYLSAGPHQLFFKNPRMPLLTFPIMISSATPDTLSFDLLPQLSQLYVVINPWGYIYVNGQEIKNYSANHPLLLLPGTYSLRFIHPTLGSVEKQITLQAGEERHLNINLFRK